MSPRYEVIIYWSKEDEAFIAEVPELPGCEHRRANQRVDAAEEILEAAGRIRTYLAGGSRLTLESDLRNSPPISTSSGRRPARSLLLWRRQLDTYWKGHARALVEPEDHRNPGPFTYTRYPCRLLA